MKMLSDARNRPSIDDLPANVQATNMAKNVADFRARRAARMEQS
jgi:hypothetical protein